MALRCHLTELCLNPHGHEGNQSLSPLLEALLPQPASAVLTWGLSSPRPLKGADVSTRVPGLPSAGTALSSARNPRLTGCSDPAPALPQFADFLRVGKPWILGESRVQNKGAITEDHSSPKAATARLCERDGQG